MSVSDKLEDVEADREKEDNGHDPGRYLVGVIVVQINVVIVVRHV